LRITVLCASAAVALLGAGCNAGSEEEAAAEPKRLPARHFRSQPDLRPPVVEVRAAPREDADDYLFLAPKGETLVQQGAMILDERGELVWFRPTPREVIDFRVQRYDGRPVLTWWTGKNDRGVGAGHFVIVDDTYRQVATVSAGNGLAADLHEFLITPRDTAVIAIYRRVPKDLSSLGGPKDGAILEGVVQELEIGTGRVLFEWHSADHVAVEESYSKLPKAEDGKPAPPFDYFHINAVDVDDDGNYLVNARNTHAVYKVSRTDGRVLWRLGGKESDYALGPGVRFAWQHDARRLPDGTLSLYDNAADDEKSKKSSRALVLRLDDARRRATLVHSYEHPTGLLATTQGNAQALDGGRLLVGWGSQPFYTEFDRDGRVLLDVKFGVPEQSDSYRVYRSAWRARPSGRPSIAVERKGDGEHTVYASWNGATDVATWQVLAGPGPQRLQPVVNRVADGFETAIPFSTRAAVAEVRALNERGAILGTSRLVSLGE
jgi:hypothetical protein